MIENLLFSNTSQLMERALDATSLRNKVIANNIANVNTPGFKRSDVVFEDELKNALTKTGRLRGFRTNERHIPIGEPGKDEVVPRVVTENTTTMRNDGNNVDIDREMALQSKNTIMYTVLAQMVSGEYQKVKSAIEGR